MSIKAIGWAWEQRVQPITKLVLLALADCSHPLTGATFPSIEHIQKVTGLCRRSVIAHLAILAKSGLIKKSPAFDEHGRQRRNDYTILLPEGAADAPPGVQEVHPRECMPCTHNLNKEPEELTKKEVPPYNGSVVAISSDDTRDFEEFWERCPKKVGKKDALKAFRGAVSSGELPVDLIGAMEYYRGWVERNSKPTQFVLHPATWLRQGRWNDELKDDENEQRPEYKNVKARLFEKWWPELVEDSSAGNENSSRRNGSRAGGPTFDLLGSFRALPGPDDETGIA